MDEDSGSGETCPVASSLQIHGYKIPDPARFGVPSWEPAGPTDLTGDKSTSAFSWGKEVTRSLEGGLELTPTCGHSLFFLGCMDLRSQKPTVEERTPIFPNRDTGVIGTLRGLEDWIACPLFPDLYVPTSASWNGYLCPAGPAACRQEIFFQYLQPLEIAFFLPWVLPVALVRTNDLLKKKLQSLSLDTESSVHVFNHTVLLGRRPGCYLN